MSDVETTPRELVEAARPRVAPRVWWLGLGATFFVACVLSLDAYLEGLPAIFERVRFLDKALHFSLAGALAFFLDGSLKRRMLRIGIVAVPVAAVLLLAPLAVEEFLQRFSTNRSSSFTDYAADVAGVATLIWLSRRVDR